MSIELAKKYAPKVDELFQAESKLSLLTNTDYDWTGAHSVKVWNVSTVKMSDYARNRDEAFYAAGGTMLDESAASLSRYGNLIDLDAQTQEMLLTRDRSFIFNIDKLDQEESGEAVEASTALARQIRERVIPEVDTYTYGRMAANAGTTVTGELTAETIYDAIVAGTEALDDAEVPDTERAIVVTPKAYRLMKKSPDINLEGDISEENRLKGVIATVDGMAVVKVPANRLPTGFNFMIAHPAATCAPVKLEDYGTHTDTPLSSGTIVTGRVCYDAFVLENKKKAIYYHTTQTTEATA